MLKVISVSCHLSLHLFPQSLESVRCTKNCTLALPHHKLMLAVGMNHFTPGVLK